MIGVRSRLGLAVVLAGGLVGCSGLEPEPYFTPVTSVVTTRSPVAVGETVVIGIIDLEARPGGRVELIDARPVEVVGDGTFMPFVVLLGEDGGIGAMETHTVLDDGRTVADRLLPIPGFELEAGVPLQVVLAVTPERPGRVAWDTTWVSFRVDGRVRSQAYTIGGVVCADIVEPAGCGE